MDVAFQWNSTTKELRVIVGGIQGDLSKAQAYWLSADTIAWNVPTDTVVSCSPIRMAHSRWTVPASSPARTRAPGR